MQGISMMSQKRSPSMLRETLNAFVAEVQDEIIDHSAARARGKMTAKERRAAARAARKAARGGSATTLSEGRAAGTTGVRRP